ncbi:hypothetical protein P7C70_g7285, partial [Phenoliferia sp. Uapishka_3]
MRRLSYSRDDTPGDAARNDTFFAATFPPLALVPPTLCASVFELSMKFILAALSFAASSALAISITTPTTWTPAGEQPTFPLFFFTAVSPPSSLSGPNTVTFASVRTDPASFAAVLVNQDGNLVPTSFTLKANVTTSTHTFTFTPSPKLLVGSGYQVNFIKNINSQHTILAQTNMFNITAPAAPVICPSNNQGTIAVNRTDDGSPVGFISSKYN